MNTTTLPNDTMSLDKLMQAYLDTLTEKEKQGYHIAKEHLGMSFQLEKSVGFLAWKENFLSNSASLQ
jgi:hypothetical protein